MVNGIGNETILRRNILGDKVLRGRVFVWCCLCLRVELVVGNSKGRENEGLEKGKESG